MLAWSKQAAECSKIWRTGSTKSVTQVQPSLHNLSCATLAAKAGEALRRTLIKNRAWRRNEAFIELIRWVVSNSAIGLGRQSFIELAAKYDLEASLDTIVRLVSDDGLRGQAIKALRTQRIPGHADLIREAIKGENRTWVKREAKKYLSAFG